MQIQAMFTHRHEEYLIFTLWLFAFFFRIFHSLKYKIRYVSDIFLPSGCTKLGENVPNRVKRDEHVVFYTPVIYSKSACVYTNQKKEHHMYEKTGSVQYKYLRHPQVKVANK